MLGQTTLTIKRAGAGSVVEGDMQWEADTTLTTLGVIRPMTDARELAKLPEGVRERARFKMYQPPTEPALVLTSPGTLIKSDRVVYVDGVGDAVDLEVIAAVDNSATFGRPSRVHHRKYILGNATDK